MKDNLFALLMNFFEKSLSQLSESQNESSSTSEEPSTFNLNSTEGERFLKRGVAHANSMRVFIAAEQAKLSKASYQFMMRMLNLNVINPDNMEAILNKFLFSQSHIITLEEMKWTMRNELATNLSVTELAFLDLVLYQDKEHLIQH